MALVRVYCGLAADDAKPQPGAEASTMTVALVDDAGRVLDVCDVEDHPKGYAYLSTLLAERASGPYSVAIAVDSDQHLVARLLAAAGWALAFADGATTDDCAERFVDELADDAGSSPRQRRALGLARALHAGAFTAATMPAPGELADLKPVLAADGALANGRYGAAVALREVLRELYPAALRAYPDPADPVALAVMDALPEPGTLAAASSGRGRDAAAAADSVTARLVADGVADPATISEAITALRVAIAETPRRGGVSRALGHAVAETVRRSVAAVKACDEARNVLINTLAERVLAGAPSPQQAAMATRTASDGLAAAQAAPVPHPPVPQPRVPQSPVPAASQPRPVAPPPKAPAPVNPPPATPAPVPVGARSESAATGTSPAGSWQADLWEAGRRAEQQPVETWQPEPAPAEDRPPVPQQAGSRRRGHHSTGDRQAESAQPGGWQAESAQPGGWQAESAQPGGWQAESAQSWQAEPSTADRRSAPQWPQDGRSDRQWSQQGRSEAPPWSEPRPASAPPAGRPVSGPGGRPVSSPPPPPGITPIAEPRAPLASQRHAPAESEGPLAEVRVPTPRSAPEGPPPGTRADWPTTPPADDWAASYPPAATASRAPSTPAPTPPAPAPNRGSSVTPPWQSDDLRPPEPPALRLVEPTLPEELRDDLGYQSWSEPPPLRLVVPEEGIPRSAPPVGTDQDDDDLLIFAQARSAWFTGPADGTEWNSSMDDGWRAAEHALQPSVGDQTNAGLPRRVPHANLIPGSPPSDSERQLRVVRDPASIAAHTSGYFNGWRRGQEVGGYPLGTRTNRPGAGAWDFARDHHAS